MSEGIKYNQRTLCLGMTESGKSELLNIQFSAIRCQRALVDTKDEFSIAGVQPAHTAAAVDWRQPTIHYVPDPSDLDDVEQFFAAAFSRRHLVVCVHELADLCEYRAHAAGPRVRRFYRQGARHGLGVLAGSQRPVEIPKSALTESDHYFVFVPRMGEADTRAIAAALAMRPDECARLIDDLHQELDDYSFLWFDRRTRALKACPPLPPAQRARNIVRRTTVA